MKRFRLAVLPVLILALAVAACDPASITANIQDIPTMGSGV